MARPETHLWLEGQDRISIRYAITERRIIMDRAARGAGTAPVLDHAFAADLEAADWAAIERGSSLSRTALEDVATAYARASATIVCYGMGITRHRTGTMNVQLIASLLLLKGERRNPGVILH